MELQKDYYTLDWNRCLEIIASYGFSPRAIWLLQIYWVWLTVVAWAGRYYGLPFKGYSGVTQLYPLSPTLFNVFFDTIIRHWVTVVEAKEEGMEGLGMLIQDLAAYFYADGELFALKKPERLQRVFDFLTGLFDRVSLIANTRKTVSMAFQPYHTPDRISLEAYERRTTGTGPTFQE